MDIDPLERKTKKSLGRLPLRGKWPISLSWKRSWWCRKFSPRALHFLSSHSSSFTDLYGYSFI